MRDRSQYSPTMNVDVSTSGEFPGAAEYAREKIGGLAHLTARPVLHARVRLTRHRDPAVGRPVVAQANIDVDGRLIRAQVQDAGAREAIDRLEARLRRRLERAEARRLAVAEAGARSWRHQSEPPQRPVYMGRPADERHVIRRKTYAMTPCSVDDAVLEMDLLDYNFHLFTERGTDTAAVVYRGGPTGYRVALVAPAVADQMGPISGPVTVSGQPAPCLTEDQATQRLGLVGLPFLFYIDAAHGRASVLYRRIDGHYGVITPAGP